MMTIQGRKDKLQEYIEKSQSLELYESESGSYEVSICRVLNIDEDLMIVVTKTRRVSVHSSTYTSYYTQYSFQSSVHWTNEILSVTLREKYLREYEVDINYGSGGTLEASAFQIATVMSHIFSLAADFVKELQAEAESIKHKRTLNT